MNVIWQQGSHRIISRGAVRVYQRKQGGHWYDQPPVGLKTGWGIVSVRDIYGDDIGGIRVGQPRDDEDRVAA